MRLIAERRRWFRDHRSPASGAAADIALVALILGVMAGVALAAGFEPRQPYQSIAAWLLANPAAVLARNAHYWAAQIAVVAAAWATWGRLREAARGGGAGWALCVALLPVAAALMLSGFMLRGDADARELQRIVESLLTAVSPAAAALLPGTGDQAGAAATFGLHAVAAAATLALAVALAVTTLPRPRLPSAGLAAAVVATVAGLSLFVSPGLHDGLDGATQGPWYFVGLQRMIEWGVSPPALAAVALALALAIAALPWLPRAWGAPARGLVGVAAAAYLLMCGIGLFVHGDAGGEGGEGGTQLAWPAARGDWQAGWVLQASAAPPAPLPVVRGRAEGCLVCHDRVDGLGASHAPARTGCAACHGGDPFALEPARAHAGMVLVPGNLADARRTCGQSDCHLATAARVERSIMSTMAGVITVDRRVLGEAVDPAAPPPHAAAIGHSVADSHLRELCVSCHLGQAKAEWGPINQQSRGGGCNACHLVYDAAAAADLARYQAGTPSGQRPLLQTHPSLTVNPGNGHCFGCHSRSSRISTSYEGWNELRGAPPPGMPAARLRQLEDGRHFERITPDIHHERGLECIDCHVAGELMGSGAVVARKTDQLIVGCEDCHAQRLASVATPSLDPESRRLLALRQGPPAPPLRVGATRSGVPMVNLAVDANGRGQLRRKRSGELLPLKPPAAVCQEGGGHRRLSCVSCHSAWAPRCTTCHTQFDPGDEGFDHVAQRWVPGTWNETAGPFEAAPPTLGLRLHRGSDGSERGVVETFVPGMIMSFDRNRDPARPADLLFRRLYGLTFAHTIRREVRPCASCHADPVALGYGRGRLRYATSAAGGRWSFEPQQPASPQDGLPADAWVGFLQPRAGMLSTRDDVRPFSVDEQRRILRVGACLSCHAPDAAALQGAVTDFDAVLARRSVRCVLPVWP